MNEIIKVSDRMRMQEAEQRLTNMLAMMREQRNEFLRKPQPRLARSRTLGANQESDGLPA